MLDHRAMTRDGTTRAVTPGRLLPLLVLGCLLAAPAAVRAHPFGERYYAHRIVLRAREGALGLQYSTEIPAGTVMRRFARDYSGLPEVGEEEDRAFTERMLTELASGLTVLVGGEAVQLTWGPMEGQPSGVGTGEFFAYHLQAEAPVVWGEAPTEILVTNDNSLDWPAYYSGWIFCEPGVAVGESSLRGIGEVASQEDVFQIADAWSRNPIYRDVAATFTVTDAAGEAPEPAAGTDGRRGWAWWWLVIAGAFVGVVGLVAMRVRAAR